ncbi:MAG TPA: hypothetical protein PK431_05125 [Chitinophagales bacterium]|nr:hypothetical protein [Chitinophagales bacterium]
MKYFTALFFCLMMCNGTSNAQLLSIENCFSGTKDDNYYFGYKFSETDSIRYIAVQSYSENNFFDTINRNIYRPGFSTNNIYLIRLNENSNTTKVIYANNIFPKNFSDNEINLEYVLNNTQIDSFVTLNIFKFDRNLDSITPFLQLEKYNVAQTGNPDIGIGFYVNSDSFHYAYGYSSRYSKIIRYKYDQTHLIQSDEIHTLRNTNNIFGTSDPDVTVFNHKIYEYINGVLKIYDAEANELASYQLLTRESSKYIDLGNGDLLLINQFRDSINFVKIKNDNSIEYNTIGISYVNNTVRINTQEYFSLIDSNLLIPFFDSDSAYFIRYNKNGNILNHYAEKYPINGSGGSYYGPDNLVQLNDSIKIILKKINNTENTIYIQKINKNGVPIQSTQLNPTIFYQNRLLVLKGYNKLIKTRKGRYFIIAFYNGYLQNSVLFEYNPQNGSLTLLSVSDEYDSYKDVYNNDKNETYIIADVNNGCIRNMDVVLYKLANGINTVKGKVFVDYNNNNTQDNGEPIYKNAKLSYSKNNITYSSFLIDTGVYSFVIDTGKYIINCGVHDSLFTVLPTNRTITHATYNNTDFINFILKPIGAVYDAEVTMNNTFVTRPGFNGTYYIFK